MPGREATVCLQLSALEPVEPALSGLKPQNSDFSWNCFKR